MPCPRTDSDDAASKSRPHPATGARSASWVRRGRRRGSAFRATRAWGDGDGTRACARTHESRMRSGPCAPKAHRARANRGPVKGGALGADRAQRLPRPSGGSSGRRSRSVRARPPPASRDAARARRARAWRTRVPPHVPAPAISMPRRGADGANAGLRRSSPARSARQLDARRPPSQSDTECMRPTRLSHGPRRHGLLRQNESVRTFPLCAPGPGLPVTGC